MVFNARMNKDETREVIKAAGGDRAFARLLSLDGTPGYQQRINNWKRRGMPAAVVLDHLPTIRALQSAKHPEAA